MSSSTFLADTSPEMRRLLFKLHREASDLKKSQLMDNACEMVRELQIDGIRERHPDASDEEVKRRLADLLFGEELAEKAFGKAEYDS